jgi:hypothetical protein
MSHLGSPGRPGARAGVGGHGAAPGEVPCFPGPGELSREGDELALDMILEGVAPPADFPPELAGLPQMLEDLSGPAEAGELAGEAAARAWFRSRVRPGGAHGAIRTPTPRRTTWRPAGRSPRLAAGLVAVVVVLGGTAAAYAGVLPGPLQNLAHRLIHAPAASHGSGDQPGVVPGHKSGNAPAVSPSRQHAPRSAAPGSAAGNRPSGKAASPARRAHPAAPRPASRPPQPNRSPWASEPPSRIPRSPQPAIRRSPRPNFSQPVHRTGNPRSA